MTKLVIFGTALLWIAYDVYAFMVGGQVNTISWNIWSMSAGTCEPGHGTPALPLLPLVTGIVLGHLFWRVRDPRDLE